MIDTTKIHALVDALGNPCQRHDIKQVDSLVRDVENTMLLVDKRYDSNALVEQLEGQKCIAVIPPKKNRKHKRYYDEHIYKERHLIEYCFRKIKYFRRDFLRFDKTAIAFMSFLQFVAVLIWLLLKTLQNLVFKLIQILHPKALGYIYNIFSQRL